MVARRCVLAAAVPRPVGLVPGLAVAKALVRGSSTYSCVQMVEVFMYPGNGQTILTGVNVSCRTHYPDSINKSSCTGTIGTCSYP